MGGNVVIGRSIYGVVILRFYIRSITLLLFCTKLSCCSRIVVPESDKLSVLSPQGFQLSTFCAGLFSSAVIFLLGGFNCQPSRFLNLSLLCSAVSGARRALSLSFLRRRRFSCSCADLRALLGLLWASMFKTTCSLKP